MIIVTGLIPRFCFFFQRSVQCQFETAPWAGQVGIVNLVSWVQDSGTEGIGYEDALKNSGGYVAPYYESTLEERMAAGTKALKKGVFKK